MQNKFLPLLLIITRLWLVLLKVFHRVLGCSSHRVHSLNNAATNSVDCTLSPPVRNIRVGFLYRVKILGYETMAVRNDTTNTSRNRIMSHPRMFSPKRSFHIHLQKYRSINSLNPLLTPLRLKGKGAVGTPINPITTKLQSSKSCQFRS